jgi:hypothetical protein
MIMPLFYILSMEWSFIVNCTRSVGRLLLTNKAQWTQNELSASFKQKSTLRKVAFKVVSSS